VIQQLFFRCFYFSGAQAANHRKVPVDQKDGPFEIDKTIAAGFMWIDNHERLFTGKTPVP
jgi:hypothetical protein